MTRDSLLVALREVEADMRGISDKTETWRRLKEQRADLQRRLNGLDGNLPNPRKQAARERRRERKKAP